MKAKINQKKTILGIDPGTRITGYGAIQNSPQGLQVLDFGCIRPPVKEELNQRYFIIYNDLIHLLEKFQPDIVAIETQFVQKNPQSALKLGMARGVILIAAKSRAVPIVEYPPARVKKAICHGRASKYQVQSMVKRLLGLSSLPEPEDAADALALAICCANDSRI